MPKAAEETQSLAKQSRKDVRYIPAFHVRQAVSLQTQDMLDSVVETELFEQLSGHQSHWYSLHKLDQDAADARFAMFFCDQLGWFIFLGAFFDICFYSS